MYKVLIVEDHALIRFGLKTAFESKNFIKDIIEVSTGEEAIKAVKENDIDIVIMDLGLPNMNGIESARIINNINKQIKIIMLTSHYTKEEVTESIKAGARAYCSKDINPERLADIIQTVTEGAIWFDSKVSDIVINAISSNNDTFNKDSINNYNLTDREIEVLDYICHGLNNTQIADKLDVSINTVKVHVSSIIQKMGVEDRTQAVVKVLNCSK